MTVPVPILSCEFKLFGVILHCHVLDNGQRIIEADDVADLFEVMGGDLDETDSTDDVERFAKWMKGIG